MRRHGWGGDIPRDDDEARARILATARELLRQRPDAAPSISEVAERLSVTRQTVYRYFPNSSTLLAASVSEGIDAFLDDISVHLRGTSDAADAVVEGIAYTYEQIHQRSDLALLIAAGGTSVREITSPTSLALGRSILERLPVDWAAAGYDDTTLDGLVELMLRTLQSFIIDPGNPPRSSEGFRTYLRRWLAPSIVEPPDRGRT
jgi:AcrR family transcriptional regulator